MYARVICAGIAMGLCLSVGVTREVQGGATTEAVKQRMAGYYRPVRVPAVKPNVPQTALPLRLEGVANWSEVRRGIPPSATALLSRNGFVVSDMMRGDQVSRFYKAVKDSGLPIFVTSDSLLHLYHIQFDETLRHVEETQFYNDLSKLSHALKAESEKVRGASKGRAKESARRCLAYFAVACELLSDGDTVTGRVPKDVAPEVGKEVELINAHRGFAGSPIFTYKEDYSQYVPRGHYTRSEKLKAYFKAMMWYGRMVFLIKGKTPVTRDVLVTKEEAQIQTLAAFQIMAMLERVNVGNRKAIDVWNRIYAVTAYYVGFADDLTPEEYRDALGRIPMDKSVPASYLIEHRWFDVRKVFALTRSPQIYGGTGEMVGPVAQIATEADLMKALEATKGLRFMGQRYVPDSFMMGRLVYPTVGPFRGKGKPFTLVRSAGGPIRGFPRGLDVMAVLGSKRAREILQHLGDDQYERYDATLKKLQMQFEAVTEKDWNRNLYWSWLHCLRALLEPAADGTPAFMRSNAWLDKQLNAALGSWAQLRHDTILYAKQSYTMLAEMAPPRPRMVEGYVEPMPEFYARLLALTRMSRAGLDDMGVLDRQLRGRLRALEGILARLLDIAVRELRNEKLRRDDYQFIKSFGDRLKAAVAGVAERGLETTIIADVHTDQNSRQVLEEGTGYLRTIAVAYPMPDGGTVIGFGPVFSYHEFKHPMADRLTDEAWKKLLRSRDKPDLPEWTKSFSVPGR